MTVRARLLGNTPVSNGWRLLRLLQPEIAAAARPGQTVALAGAGEHCVHHAHVAEGWFSLLIPPPRAETIAGLTPPRWVEVEGPRGQDWALRDREPPALVVGGGAGLPAALFLIERLVVKPVVVLLGAEAPPFRPVPSGFLIHGLPPGAIAAAPALEAAGIASRLASPQGLPGCFEGEVEELARLWLASHPREEMPVYACLPATGAMPELAPGRLRTLVAPSD